MDGNMLVETDRRLELIIPGCQGNECMEACPGVPSYQQCLVNAYSADATHSVPALL